MRKNDHYDYDNDECEDKEYDPLEFFEGIEKYVFNGLAVIAAMSIVTAFIMYIYYTISLLG